MICASHAIAFLSLLGLAVSIHRGSWSPPITNPNGDSCWPPGSNQSLRWNVTSKPTLVAYPYGSAFLVVNGIVRSDIYELATDFEVDSGEVNITIPNDENLTAGKYYNIELFSGIDKNWSPLFYIDPNCAL